MSRRFLCLCLLTTVCVEVSSFQGGLGSAGLRYGSIPSQRCLPHAGRVATIQSNRVGVSSLRAEGGSYGSGDIERLFSPFGEAGKKVGRSIDWFFDTSDVAGAKAWRLQMPPGEADATKWRSGDLLEEMAQEEISNRREKALSSVSAPGVDVLDGYDLAEEEDLFANGFEYSMTDEDLGDALKRRFESISRGARDPIGSEEDLTGLELAEMCVKKYGVAYDMAIKVDKLALVSDKKLVSLNLYYAYYGQLNPEFPYTENEYLTRLGALASLVNKWGQQEYVREFFREKPTPYRGLPSRPRWDTAVSIRLNKSPTWNPDLADEFFHT